MRKFALAVGLLLVIAAAAAAAAGWWTWQRLQTPHRSYAGDGVTVEVEPGMSAVAILESLAAEGVIADAELARLFLIHRLGDPHLRAGEYRFEQPLSTPEVLEKLVRGEVVSRAVTVVEGLTLWEAAAAIANAGFGDEERLVEEMLDPARVADLDSEAETLEGYLFPDTYRFTRSTTEAEIVDHLVETFRRRWVEVEPLLPEGQTVRDLVTLASIVEKEVSLDEERAVVAGVYANRLRRNIGLYADPTVIYALRLLGRWDGDIKSADLRMDHPYNTYVVAGLPPGPICSPSLDSLLAAAQPAAVDYLYFVSRNDGSHVFARTLAEHNRNVDQWQRRYWREKRAAERAAEGD